MNSDDRKRFLSNQECIAVVNKPLEEITDDERDKLKTEFTGYGSVLGKAFGLAQFYTPSHVAKFLCDYINPLLPNNARVLEPACGNGSLIRNIKSDSSITCVEVDNIASKILQICYPEYEVINDSAMNFKRSNTYDLVIANPPFNLNIEGDIEGWQSAKFNKKKGKYIANSDAFFIEQAIDSLKIGGYGVFILPPSIGYKAQLKKVRQLLLDKCWIISTIELPAETFSASGTNIKTMVLIFRKAPKLPKFKSTSSESEGEFLLGQPPIIQIQINDIGFDKKGRPTNKYADNDWYDSQLDEALDILTDDLYRDNTCPEVGVWSDKEDITQSICFHEASLGYMINKGCSSDKTDMVYYQDLTLGRGCEIEYEGEEYSTLDWEVMDRLVDKYC
ncbi:MAG: HsdM family class I SAM-dependent methyltransferase [Clostridium sp.]|uniref:HsdM family class I SAM-dependent methyltransferase n=1 Tax=Clostridium sp. TaxID=1506 RepID=UPI003F2C93B0